MTTDKTEAAGASARREYERRKANDEAKIRKEWGRLGGIAVALSNERQSTTAWSRGARGEELLGAQLDRIASSSIRLLHDRRIPGSRGNVDHLAITRQGIWVIDAKRYTGRPELRVEGGIIRPRLEKLIVARRDKTKLVDGVAKQIEHVREAVPDVLIRGVLCFVEADWPLFGGNFTIRGIDVCWPKHLVASIAARAAGDVDVDTTYDLIAKRFRAA